MRTKLIFSLSLFFLLPLIGVSAPTKRLSPEDKELMRMVTKVRTKKAITVVASPDGKVAGTVTMEDAIAKLKAGNVLRIMPGRYQKKGYRHWNNIEIEPDNVIIEGDGSGRMCEISITLWGQGCGIRDFWGHTIEGEGLIVVDSRIRPHIASSGKRSRTCFYNCLLTMSHSYTSHYYWHCMELFANNAEIIFKKCTLVSMYVERKTYTRWQVGGGLHGSGGFSGMISLGRMAKKGVIKFSECVIYTNGYLFRGRFTNKDDFSAALNVVFEDCIIYVGKGYFMAETNTSDIKDLKKFAKVKTLGDNVFKKAAFVKPPKLSSYKTSGRDYMLSEASEAKKRGIGANIGMNGLPMPPEATEKESKKDKKGK